MPVNSHPSQQHEGLQNAVWWLQQEVTRPKVKFKPTLPKKSGVDGGIEPMVAPMIIAFELIAKTNALCFVIGQIFIIVNGQILIP